MSILYLLLTLLLLGILIFLHEGGHFLFARLNGITVNEFAIGMGPKIISWVSKKTQIRYSLRLFPIGGFVSMAGEDEETEDENAFYKKSVWRRILTVIAGPLTNILIGFVGMLVLVIATTPASNIIANFSENSVSNNYGLEAGDTIVEVNGVKTYTGNEVFYEITYRGAEPVDITVVRDGERVVLEDVIFETEEEDGVMMGKVDIVFYAATKDFGTIISHTFHRSVSTVKMIWDSVIDLISGKYGLDSISGPIGMTELVSDAIQASWQSLLYLMVVISVNLGVMNLLPIPALDGGRLVFLLIEAVTRKQLNKNIEGYINFVGIVILLIFMAIVAFKDILKLF